ncbi:MAG: cytochrome-c3 hydrogenase subunit gamma [Candidatus Korarchaeota archaeon NZ13-K]|nr:MAG: cytochrome-c3 hydrogenase subunit gamma [Candidatus Korarchaeota archaeon NZ13-K]
MELQEEQFVPKPAEILDIREMTSIERLFSLRFLDEEYERSFRYMPGQFVQLSVYGVGETTISICRSQTRPGPLELLVRRVGRVTNALHRLRRGDVVGLRGPFGNWFPVEEMEGSDVLLIAGGLGMAPLRGVLQYVLDRRERYGDVNLLYGVKSYEETLFREEVLEPFERDSGFRSFISFEKDDPFYEELMRRNPERVRKGVVTVLFELADRYLDPKNTYAVVCGPPVMYRFVLRELDRRGFSPRKVYVTLERRMRCGVGKCGHCIIGGATSITYVCKDGPVFSYFDVLSIRGAI